MVGVLAIANTACSPIGSGSEPRLARQIVWDVGAMEGVILVVGGNGHSIWDIGRGNVAKAGSNSPERVDNMYSVHDIFIPVSLKLQPYFSLV